MRPVLPRTSSGMSGFFFCGMMDEPVQKASGSSMKPNGALIHRISSSAMRERWMAQMAAPARISITKSRSETASSELRQGPSKPSAAAVASRSIGKVVPASAAEPSGHWFMRARASASRAASRSSISTQASR